MNKILYHIKPGTSNFFLGDFPDEFFKIPLAIHFETYAEYSKASDKYMELFEACKEEAINNGEIVNPDVIPNVYKDVADVWYITKWLEEYPIHNLKDGDIFDTPEGVKVERVPNYYYKNKGTCGITMCYSIDETIKDKCLGWCKTAISLVPSDKEEKENADKLLSALSVKHETQEELCKYMLELSGHHIQQWAPDYLNQVLQIITDNFTITRKK